MQHLILGLCLVLVFSPLFAADLGNKPSDIISTTEGDLKITFIGHGTLMLTFQDLIIHVDPYSKLADYSTLPKADLIVLTHEHRDHLDLEAIGHIRTPKTAIVLTSACSKQLDGGFVMQNGEHHEWNGIKFDAIPAYNLVHKRENGQPYHPKGEGNGYVLTFGKTRVYIAGDTENTPEMKALKNIDIAFLPMNLPYTMTPEMVAEAVQAFKPKIVYPYHYGETDPNKLTELLAPMKDVEVRIRPMK